MKAKTANARQLDILGNAVCSSEREIFAETVRQWSRKLGYWSIFAAVPAILASHVTEARSDKAKKTEASIAGRVARRLEKLNLGGSSPALLKRQSEFRLPHQKDGFDMFAELGGNDDCPGQQISGGTYTTAAPYIVTGDTTGANDTISRVLYTYYANYQYDANGPDHVYSFTVTGLGPNPQLHISTTSSTYKPLIYILRRESSGDDIYRTRIVGCPAGTGNHAYNQLLMAESRRPDAPTPFSGSTSLFSLPLNVPLLLFVDSAQNDARGSGPYTIRMQDVTIAPGCPETIDCPEFFVTRQYLDFLNRQPDAGGLAYWTNEINQCGGDAACVHRRRIGVSAAFFIEQEFQETGYYVYRFYKASFGRQPNYVEFSGSRTVLMGGANKQVFADWWVQRPSFVAAYPTTMSNTEFVNKLFDSAGLIASRYDPLRQQEISAMNAGRSRAQVLRDVIEIPDFKNVPDPNDPRYNELKQVSQYNPAFVLMQYFGYLRRDVDPAGYAFWLDVVNNREPNDYRGMVCAFITSTEYQLRFGSTATRSNADCAQ